VERDELCARFAAAGFSTAACENPSVLGAFPIGIAAFEVTSGGCACNMVVAASRGDAASERGVLRARYRAKHPRWSEAKITRAVEAARLPSDPSRRRGDKSDTFRDVVVELVSRLGVVHVFWHEYSGHPSTEEIAVCPNERLPLAAYVEAGGALPSDTIVAIER
jgi:hypothetical protein